MGGTYAGNAVACAAAVETQRVLRDESLVQNSVVMGGRLQGELQALGRRHRDGVVRDVRGLGCMIGVELDARFPSGTAKAIAQECCNTGLLLLSCSVYETVRFIPPLSVNADEIDRAVEIFDAALTKVTAGR